MDRDKAYLFDMVDSATIAVEYLSGMQDFSEFESNLTLQDAVIRRLELVGEAANRVSSKTQSALGSIPWPKIVSMRNFLIHEYDEVDLHLVWRTVKNNLPRLVSELENSLKEDKSSS